MIKESKFYASRYETSQQTRQCWFEVGSASQTLRQHCFNVSCLVGKCMYVRLVISGAGGLGQHLRFEYEQCWFRSGPASSMRNQTCVDDSTLKTGNIHSLLVKCRPTVFDSGPAFHKYRVRVWVAGWAYTAGI